MIAVLTSFLSLCFAFVMWRQAVEEDAMKKKDEALLGKDIIQEDGATEKEEMLEKGKVKEKEDVLEMEAAGKESLPEMENVKEKEEMNDENAEQKIWDWKDMLVDMVWNILSIGPRVIALALFASYQMYWFWGLIGLQLIGSMLIFLPITCDRSVKFCQCTVCIATGLFIGLGTVFTMFVFLLVPFFCYLLYWILMFTENTVMISLWYQWSSDLGLWYHDAALAFVTVGYVLSLIIIKCVHCSFYNKKRESIFEWDF